MWKHHTKRKYDPAMVLYSGFNFCNQTITWAKTNVPWMDGEVGS